MEEADQLCGRVAIMDHGRILALDTPEALKQTVDADTVVTLSSSAALDELEAAVRREIPEITRARPVAGGLELAVKGAERLLPRVVEAADGAGLELADLSISKPSLETVFIELTGRELRD
jgi:ABC-2 type transport system ATP-binding protein